MKYYCGYGKTLELRKSAYKKIKKLYKQKKIDKQTFNKYKKFLEGK